MVCEVFPIRKNLIRKKLTDPLHSSRMILLESVGTDFLSEFHIELVCVVKYISNMCAFHVLV